MAHGNLVKILLHTKVTRYLDFKAIDGSYVVKSQKVHKVPVTPKEALNSALMGNLSSSPPLPVPAPPPRAFPPLPLSPPRRRRLLPRPPLSTGHAPASPVLDTDPSAGRSPVAPPSRHPGMFEKRRFRSFLIYMQDYEAGDASTHKGRDLNTMTAAALYAEFGLDTYTQEFIGHAMALFTDEQYLSQVSPLSR